MRDRGGNGRAIALQAKPQRRRSEGQVIEYAGLRVCVFLWENLGRTAGGGKFVSQDLMRGAGAVAVS